MEKEKIVTHNTAGLPAMRIINENHRRFNDSYNKGATSILSIVSYDGTRKNPDAWVSIGIEVIDPADSRGTRKSRTHYVTLDAEARADLIRVLTEMDAIEPHHSRPCIF